MEQDTKPSEYFIGETSPNGTEKTTGVTFKEKEKGGERWMIGAIVQKYGPAVSVGLSVVVSSAALLIIGENMRYQPVTSSVLSSNPSVEAVQAQIDTISMADAVYRAQAKRFEQEYQKWMIGEGGLSLMANKIVTVEEGQPFWISLSNETEILQNPSNAAERVDILEKGEYEVLGLISTQESGRFDLWFKVDRGFVHGAQVISDGKTLSPVFFAIRWDEKEQVWNQNFPLARK